MSEGNKKVSQIMAGLAVHLKPNTYKDNHYNRVYEAFWKIITQLEERDELVTQMHGLLKEKANTIKALQEKYRQMELGFMASLSEKEKELDELKEDHRQGLSARFTYHQTMADNIKKEMEDTRAKDECQT